MGKKSERQAAPEGLVGAPPASGRSLAAIALGLVALMGAAVLLDTPVVVAERAVVEAAVLPATPRIAGRVVSLGLVEGARVRKGQVLAALDAGELADEVSRAEAALAAAESGLPASRTAAALIDVQRGASVEQAGAAVEAARADWAAAKARAAATASSAEALKAGRARGVVATQEVVAAEAEARSARAGVEAAAGRIKAAETALALARKQAGIGTVERTGLARSEAEVRQARALLAIARRRREQATIVAPADGVIARKLVGLGDQVVPGQPVYTLLADGAPWVRAEVRELDAPAVRAGARAEVTLDAWPDRRWSGRVLRVGVVAEPADPAVARTAPTVALTIALDAAPGPAPVPGLTARARILRANALTWGTPNTGERL